MVSTPNDLSENLMAKPVLESGTVTRFALVTAAVGAGFAGQADAAMISTAPVGFTPVTLTTDTTTGPGSSFAVDLDQNGTTDYTLQAFSNRIQLNPAGNNQSDIIKFNVATG